MRALAFMQDNEQLTPVAGADVNLIGSTEEQSQLIVSWWLPQACWTARQN